MSESTPNTVAFVLYMLLFGWIGYRRGMFRELTVLIVSVGGIFALQQNQNQALDIVRQALSSVLGAVNMGGKFLADIRSGNMGGDGDTLFTLTTASNLIADSDEPKVAFLIWSGLLLLAYVLTNKVIPDSRSASGFIASVMGIINGLFYSFIFPPRLVSFISPEVEVESVSLFSTGGGEQALRDTLETMRSNFDDIWSTLEPQRPILIAGALTLLLVAVIGTLRRQPR